MENLNEIKQANLVSFMERLRKVSVALGFRSLQSFQARLGFSNSYFRNMGRINPEAEKRILAAYPDVNIEYIRTGAGAPLRESAEKEIIANVVPLLPVYAQGGSLNDFDLGVIESECEKIVSPIRDATLAITVTGDSMSPDYPNGSIVFVQKIDDKAFIEWGRTYVLDTINGVVVKNVHYCESDESRIVCRSINPNYADFTINREHIRGWYRVRCQLALK